MGKGRWGVRGDSASFQPQAPSVPVPVHRLVAERVAVSPDSIGA
jgi:hypothetical protein